MRTPEDDTKSQLTLVQQRWVQRASQRATRVSPLPPRRAEPQLWLIGLCVGVLLIAGVMWMRGARRAIQIPSQATAAGSSRAGVGGTFSGAAQQPLRAKGATLQGAIIAYGGPTRNAGCAALGAVEPGRGYTLRERQGAWSRLDVEGSGAVWTNVLLPKGAAIGVRSTLQAAIVAYAAPAQGARGCPGLIGAIEPGRPYTVIEQRAGWTRLRVEGSGEIWTNATIKASS